jgi:hypothetical protein
MSYSTFTWISDTQDVFKELFGIPDYLIETPLGIDNIFIQSYTKTPLYNGIYKNEVYGQIEELKTLIDNKFSFPAEGGENRVLSPKARILSFYVPGKNVSVIKGLSDLLKLILNNVFNYNVTYVDYNNDTLTPMDLIYITDNIIDINSLIGYKPLLDYYDETVWVPGVAYKNIFNIPVVRVNNDKDKENLASLVEFAIDNRDTIVGRGFAIDLIYKDIVMELARVFKFDTFELTINKIGVDGIDKLWLMDNIYNISVGKLPMTKLIFKGESNITNMAKWKFAAIRTVIDLAKKEPLLLNHLRDIVVTSDLIVYLPTLTKDTTMLHQKIELYNKHLHVQVYNTKEDAIDSRINNTAGIYLSFPINPDGTWVVVGTMPILTTKNKNNIKTNDEYGVYELIDKVVEPIKIDIPYNFNLPNLTVKQIEYLWQTGKFLQDWAFYYYKQFNTISTLPFKPLSEVQALLTANV